MRTVLFVGAGRHQRQAILRARELGLRVAAVDGDPKAPGLGEADIPLVADFRDVEAVLAFARRVRPHGVLTVSADRAVPVVAAVAEALGLPGIGVDTARRLTHKVEMRRTLAAAGIPQPAFGPARTLEEARAALAQVGVPAVLKPADSGGQRGLFRLGSVADLDASFPAALAESPTGQAIVEELVPGTEMNGIAIARRGAVSTLTLSDRLRPPGRGFGVGWIHLYPASLSQERLRLAEEIVAEAVRALGLRDGIAFPQLIAGEDGGLRVVEVAARIPGGQMADLVRHAVGVDLTEIALRQALGEPVPDELCRPRFRRALAIRFLTASPGPLPVGKVRAVRGLERALAQPGVVQAESYMTVGETIRPVRLDGDRRGYVIAVGESREEALARAEAATALIEVEVE
ncbi:MAG: hypothetical protein C4306_08885 [Thermoleophilia bacterium]